MRIFNEMFVISLTFMLVFSMCFISASEIEEEKDESNFFTKILNWFKSIFRSSDIQEDSLSIDEQKNNTSLVDNLASLGNNIPLVGYTCESVFPNEIKIYEKSKIWIETRDTEYTNGVPLSITCYRESRVGGNINRYTCLSGFFVYEDVLPDGTMVNEYNHVEYNFVLDKRNCVEEICSPIEMSCVVENFSPPKIGSPDYLDYYSQPIIKSNTKFCEEGCVGNNGECYPIGSIHNGQVCSE